MKKHLLILIIASSSVAAPIETKSLDSGTPMVIDVGSKTVTSLLFPEPVSSVAGYGLTTGDAPGTYHFTHDAQNNLILLRNLMPDKRCSMTVLMGKSLFVFELIPSKTPMIAVTLEAAREARPAARETSPEAIIDNRIDYTPERLFNLMKLAKHESVLRPHLPEYYRDSESLAVEWKRDYGAIQTVIDNVSRFKASDAFVFLGRIINTGPSDYPLDTARLRVLVGQQLLPLAAIRLDDHVAAGASVEFQCVVMGNAFGGREHLSIGNDFFLLLSPESASTSSPSTPSRSTLSKSKEEQS